jgi:hypothetical protein
VQLAQLLVTSLLGRAERRRVLFRHWFGHPFLDNDPSILANLEYFIGVWLYASFDVCLELVHGKGTPTAGWLRLMGNAVSRLTIPIALLTAREYKCVMLIVAQSKAAFTQESVGLFRQKLNLSGFTGNTELESCLNRPAFVQTFCQDLVREAGLTHHFQTKDIVCLALDHAVRGRTLGGSSSPTTPSPQQRHAIRAIQQAITVMNPFSN